MSYESLKRNENRYWDHVLMLANHSDLQQDIFLWYLNVNFLNRYLVQPLWYHSIQNSREQTEYLVDNKIKMKDNTYIRSLFFPNIYSNEQYS